MAVSKAERDRRAAILLAGLKHYCTKHGDRDKLTVGEHRIAGAVNATVGRMAVSFTFSGDVIVSPDQPPNSQAPDAAHVAALLLARFDRVERVAVLERIRRHFKREGSLPPVDAELVEVTRAALKDLRGPGDKPKRGSVVLRLDDPPDKAA